MHPTLVLLSNQAEYGRTNIEDDRINKEDCIMEHIDFFKLQAKNLMRDYKTQFKDETGVYQYSPRFFFDIDEIINSYDIDENNFSLMKAQHYIAKLAGFYNWSELSYASDAKLELGKLLLENRNECDSIGVPLLDSWKMYRDSILQDHNFDDQTLLTIFKAVYLEQYD